MKPTTLTVFELFEKERRYVVPLFQRPYVWDRERQWEPLWIDIATKADEVLSRTEQLNAAGPEAGTDQTLQSERTLRNHFLGAVVLNQIKTFGKQVSATEVIDGQQRLTTLQVLLVALRDYIKATGQTELDATLDKLTANRCRLDQAYEQHKVWPTTTDRAVFEAIVGAGSPNEVMRLFPQERIKYTRKLTPRPRMVEAYLFFYNAIRLYAALRKDDLQDNHTGGDNSAVSPDRLDGLVAALTRYLELVVIELEERDDPQVIFETLNARMEPLLPSDLIRNFVFLEATRCGDEVNRLYDAYWRQYDEAVGNSVNFWKALERQGRLTRPRIDLFFFHYLSYKTGHDLLITHVFQEFRDWWNRKRPPVEAQLRDLQTHASVFRSLLEPNTNTRFGVLAQRLRLLDTSTVYPLLLFFLGEKRNEIGEAELERIAIYLESYLIRRMICNLTAKNYNRTFLLMLRDLRRVSNLSASSVADLLNDMKGDAVRWPDDEEFRRHWLASPVYQVLTPRRVAMVLEAVERQLHTSKQEDVSINAPVTVEHVMPQSPSELDWPLPAEAQGDEQARLRAITHRTQMSHTFGNLTLLTQALNSSVSNGPFVKKQPEITKQSVLLLNAYFQRFNSGGEWTEERIRERGDELFELARVIWPYVPKG